MHTESPPGLPDQSPYRSSPISRGRRSIVAALLLTASLGANLAWAAAPQHPQQVPGYYRVMVGDIEVTALFDGAKTIPSGTALKNVVPADIHRLLQRALLPDDVPTSFNAFLINTGSTLLLVDSGAGRLFGSTLGQAMRNLLESGYRPEQVDQVLLTHLHIDHVGGLTLDGVANYPNATIRLHQSEADYWLSPQQMQAAPAAMQNFFKAAQDSLQPYVARGRLQTFRSDTVIAPGVSSVALPGHSPGHTGYLVQSKGEQLLLWGDVTHVEAVQLSEPQTTFRADSDPEAAAAQRRAVFRQAVQQNHLIGGAHLPFPGLGRLRKEGKEYLWVPVRFTPLP